MAARTMQPITSMIRYITGISEQEKMIVSDSTSLTRVRGTFMYSSYEQRMVCSQCKKQE
jgi:hypothetical protein